MVVRADVMLEWANGTYLFALKGREIEMLESECVNPETGGKGIGLGSIWMRVMGSSWYRSDVTNIIRLGLMGGGLGAVEATRLVSFYADNVPISSMKIDFGNPNCPLAVARAVLSAAVVGIEADQDAGEPPTPES